MEAPDQKNVWGLTHRIASLRCTPGSVVSPVPGTPSRGGGSRRGCETPALAGTLEAPLAVPHHCCTLLLVRLPVGYLIGRKSGGAAKAYSS